MKSTGAQVVTAAGIDTLGLHANLLLCTGPDRDLDVQIHIAFVRPDCRPVVKGDLPSRPCDQPGWITHDGLTYYEAPKYTASIDAVVALAERQNPRAIPARLETAIGNLRAFGYRPEDHHHQIARAMLIELVRAMR